MAKRTRKTTKKQIRNKVLVLPDMHAPWADMEAIELAYRWAKNHQPDLIIQMGDLIDGKAWSRWPKDPDDPSPREEYIEAKKQLAQIAKWFPKMHVLTGNHDTRWMKKAFEVGIPKELVRTPQEVLGGAGWTWHTEARRQTFIETKRGRVLFIHGDEMGGPVLQKAINLGCNTVQGHTHKVSIGYKQTFDKFVFGFECGHLMDTQSKAADYSASNPVLSTCGFGVIQYGLPFFIPADGSKDI